MVYNMYIVKNKALVDSQNNVIKTIKNEVFLTADISLNYVDYQQYVNAVRSNLALHVIKLFILNNDETAKEDVSKYVLSGNLSYNYQQGQTHSLNLTVVNNDGFWDTDPINGNICNGTKFRLDIGLYANDVIYWRKCGIFVLKDVSYQGTPTQTVSLQLYDKFSLFDKKLCGNIDSDFKIPVGTNLVTALNMCLQYDSGDGLAYDSKDIICESDLSSIVTPYTITKSPNTSIGDVMIELANMVSNDIFYNENGNLTLRPGVEDTSYDVRGVQWYYTGNNHLDYTNQNYNIDYGSIVNKVIVRGAILNGYQFKGIAINNNPFSKSNVYLNRINSELIEDSNITTDDLANERARYELEKRLILYTKNSFKSIFIPHLMAKDIIMWTCPEFKIYNEKFVIQSLSFQLGSGFFMDIEMANVKEVSMIA